MILDSSPRSHLTKSSDKNIVPAARPIHLHGHELVLPPRSTAQYNVERSIDTFKFAKIPGRGVALLSSTGYAAIAFRSDISGL